MHIHRDKVQGLQTARRWWLGKERRRGVSGKEVYGFLTFDEEVLERRTNTILEAGVTMLLRFLSAS